MSVQARVADRVDELQVALADDAAFESWYRRTLPRVYSYLLSRSGGEPTLAEELTQQTYVAAIAQRARYDGMADTVTWLCAIARHKLADDYRGLEREGRRTMHLAVRQLAVEQTEDHGSALDDRPAIAEAFRSLPPDHRAVLAFVVLDDLPVAEAARLMGRSAGATQSLLHRARGAFKRAYRGDASDD